MSDDLTAWVGFLISFFAVGIAVGFFAAILRKGM